MSLSQLFEYCSIRQLQLFYFVVRSFVQSGRENILCWREIVRTAENRESHNEIMTVERSDIGTLVCRILVPQLVNAVIY